MWHFWIDVGGTFTDCVAQSPGGKLLQTKVLSSGQFKGRIRLDDLFDAARAGEPAGFWNTARLNWLNEAGESISSATVEGFERGQFVLREPINAAADVDS